MGYNILVVDDDEKRVTRLMKNLRRNDKDSLIDNIVVDSSIVSDGNLEGYDPNTKFGNSFDLVLIDYQLGCSFTGVLVSAWTLFLLNVPRVALTSAPYTGSPNYFSDYILKREVTDSPDKVLSKIQKCIEEYDENKWLESQHRLLVEQYQGVLRDNDGKSTDYSKAIEALLDKFEKILDSKQEENIKKGVTFESESKAFSEKIEKNEEEINSLKEKLQQQLEELGNTDGTTN